jgi:hypothetical protein
MKLLYSSCWSQFWELKVSSIRKPAKNEIFNTHKEVNSAKSLNELRSRFFSKLKLLHWPFNYIINYWTLIIALPRTYLGYSPPDPQKL